MEFNSVMFFPLAINASSSRLFLLALNVALFNCCCSEAASIFLAEACVSSVLASFKSFSFSSPVFVAADLRSLNASSFNLSASVISVLIDC